MCCGHQLAGVEMCTGALGHGLPVGLGMALGAKLRSRDFRTVVMLGDGELQEGMEAGGRDVDGGAVELSGLQANISVTWNLPMHAGDRQASFPNPHLF